jgi:hypothetical protein
MSLPAPPQGLALAFVSERGHDWTDKIFKCHCWGAGRVRASARCCCLSAFSACSFFLRGSVMSPSRCALRARRIVSDFSRALTSDGFS